MKKPFPVRRLLLDALLYVLGCFCYALAVNVFTAPNQIAPGGVTGVATLLNYVFQVPIGIIIFLINIPLLIASWLKLGKGFTIRTFIVTAISSIIIDAMGSLIPAFHGDKILVVIAGGVLMGSGLGLIFMRGATTGGAEIVARLLELKYRHIPIGRLILLVDAVVVGLSILVYRNVESALYAAVMIYISSGVMDAIIYGSERGKMVLIMSSHEQEIAETVMQKMGRGITMLNAKGAYTACERQVILCAIRRSEVYALRTLVYDIDPQAFVIVTTTDEVLGKGFKNDIQ